MANKMLDGLRAVVRAASRLKLTEMELVHALGEFSRDVKNGDRAGWGLNGFATNLDRYAVRGRGKTLVHLTCDGCSASKSVTSEARKDHSHCNCGGRWVRGDQAGIERKRAWTKPNKDRLPTLDELMDVADRNEKTNPVLARMVLKQIENGAFRGAPANMGAVNKQLAEPEPLPF